MSTLSLGPGLHVQPRLQAPALFDFKLAAQVFTTEKAARLDFKQTGKVQTGAQGARNGCVAIRGLMIAQVDLRPGGDDQVEGLD